MKTKIRSQHYEQKIKIKKTLLQKTLETKKLIFRKGKIWKLNFGREKYWRETLEEKKIAEQNF